MLKLFLSLILVPKLVYNSEMNNLENSINGRKLDVYRRDKSKNWQILNGKVGKIEDFPYMASINYMDDFKNIIFACAGNIISEYYILSAAHCAVNYDMFDRYTVLEPENYGVDVGSSYWSFWGQHLDVSEVHVHPDHNKEGTMGRDISVLKTVEKILINSKVAVMPVAGPDESHFLDGMENSRLVCVVAGWGSTRFEGHVSQVLRYVKLPLMPIQTCIQLGKGSKFHITKKLHICTYLMNKDSCSGDSGSGLVCRTKDGVKRIWGIVSFADRCGEKLKPGYYSRVDNAYSFLEQFLPKKEAVSRSIGSLNNDHFKCSILIGFQIIFVPVIKRLYFFLGN